MLGEGDAVSHELAVPTRTLADCEVVIERGLKTFVEVGEALLEIRDQRLYRAGYATFEDYCQERWGWGKSRAEQMMTAAKVTAALSEHTNVGIDNGTITEAHARELVSLSAEPEVMADAWRQAVETAPNGKVTAEHVRDVVQEYRTPTPTLPTSSVEVWSAEERELQARLEAGETTVVSFRCHENLIAWARERDLFVRIDRQSDWGNPFEVDKDGDRATVIANYRDHFWPCKPSLHVRLDELKGKALGCWCAPEPCHGDVLVVEVDGDS